MRVLSAAHLVVLGLSVVKLIQMFEREMAVGMRVKVGRLAGWLAMDAKALHQSRLLAHILGLAGVFGGG